MCVLLSSLADINRGLTLFSLLPSETWHIYEEKHNSVIPANDTSIISAKNWKPCMLSSEAKGRCRTVKASSLVWLSERGWHLSVSLLGEMSANTTLMLTNDGAPADDGTPSVLLFSANLVPRLSGFYYSHMQTYKLRRKTRWSHVWPHYCISL